MVVSLRSRFCQHWSLEQYSMEDGDMMIPITTIALLYYYYLQDTYLGLALEAAKSMITNLERNLLPCDASNLELSQRRSKARQVAATHTFPQLRVIFRQSLRPVGDHSPMEPGNTTSLYFHHG